MAACLSAVLKIFEIGGGGILNSENRFQRHLHDLMGMRNHPFAIPESWAGTYSKALLGSTAYAVQSLKHGVRALDPILRSPS